MEARNARCRAYSSQLNGKGLDDDPGPWTPPPWAECGVEGETGWDCQGERQEAEAEGAGTQGDSSRGWQDRSRANSSVPPHSHHAKGTSNDTTTPRSG